MNDLTKHFIAGAIISTVVVVLGISIYGKYIPDGVTLTAFFLPFIAGVTKEAYDFKSGTGTAEVADITFTWSGGAVVTFLWKLIENFI